MNLLIEVNQRLEKYRISLEKTPEKREVIQKEIDFLTKIKEDFIEIKEDLINFHDLVFLPNLNSESRFEDLQGLQVDFVKKYPDFDSSLLRIVTQKLDYKATLELLTNIYNDLRRKKEYFTSQNNEKKVKETEIQLNELSFIFNQFALMINLVQVCKYALDFGFHIELMKLFL